MALGPSFAPDCSKISFRSSFQLPVAVKSLRNSLSRQTETLTDFLQEVTTMQSLEHPNIVRLYGVVLTQPLKMVRYLLACSFYCLISFNSSNFPSFFATIQLVQ